MSEPTEPDYLTVDDLLEVAVGILGEAPVRDLGLLASAADRPRTTVFGEDAYPTFADKAAALMHSLARNPPLVDGNKRLAWAATRAFCLLNARDIRYDVAAGDLDVPDIAAWIASHLVTTG